MKPKDLLRDLAISAFIFDKRQFGIGKLIERLPKEKRDLLSKLKSDDIKNERW